MGGKCNIHGEANSSGTYKCQLEPLEGGECGLFNVSEIYLAKWGRNFPILKWCLFHPTSCKYISISKANNHRAFNTEPSELFDGDLTTCHNHCCDPRVFKPVCNGSRVVQEATMEQLWQVLRERAPITFARLLNISRGMRCR